MSLNQAAAEARYAELHKDLPYHDGTFKRWAKERSSEFPCHFTAGVEIWVSDEDLAPHDHFLGGKKACDVCSPSGVDGRPLGDESRPDQGHDPDDDQGDR